MRIVRRRKRTHEGADHHSKDNRGSMHSRFDDQELRAMQRSPNLTKPAKCLYCILAEELFWGTIFSQAVMIRQYDAIQTGSFLIELSDQA